MFLHQVVYVFGLEEDLVNFNLLQEHMDMGCEDIIMHTIKALGMSPGSVVL